MPYINFGNIFQGTQIIVWRQERKRAPESHKMQIMTSFCQKADQECEHFLTCRFLRRKWIDACSLQATNIQFRLHINKFSFQIFNQIILIMQIDWTYIV